MKKLYENFIPLVLGTKLYENFIPLVLGTSYLKEKTT
jgi:hypothetical protein